jgi:hypothetical protein
MRVRIASSVVIASLACAAVAAAQTDTARTRPSSTRRIPISKEAPAPAPAPRVDTVTVYHTDTVATTRTDTVTVTRVDTVRASAGEVAAVTMPTVLRRIGGFYIGVDGGAAVPSGTGLNTAQSTGWHLDVPFGWDPVGSPLGVRFAAGYSHFDTKNAFENTAFDNPQIWSGDADLKLHLPTVMAWNRRFSIYGIGGASYNRFKSLVQSGEDGLITVGDQTGSGVGIFPTTADNSWHDAWGWNAGGGLEFGFGRTNLFVESRYVRFNRSGGNLSQVPVVVGLSWF